MANLHDVRPKEVFVTIGDREMSLKFTMNTFADLEDQYGTVQKALEKMSDGSIKTTRKLLFLGLKHNDMDMTEESLGEMIVPADMAGIAGALTLAMEVAMPKVPEGGISDPNLNTQKTISE